MNTENDSEKIPVPEQTDDKTELEELRKEKQQRSRLRNDIDELQGIFPDIRYENIPDIVWDKVANGESLTGAYCVYYLKRLSASRKINEKNEKNMKSAPPDIKSDVSDDYYSPDRVKGMNEKDVLKNYDAIIRSMENWR